MDFPSTVPHESHSERLPQETTPSAELAADPEYQSILENDVIGAVRTLVNKCRASGQRREEFRRIIEEGNEARSTPASS